MNEIVHAMGFITLMSNISVHSIKIAVLMHKTMYMGIEIVLLHDIAYIKYQKAPLNVKIYIFIL